ncbi:MAG: hypothetical protein HY820_46040 [Acidobacteria bacterium]|nr:hypothetical protein [Acidobacteriota bacterium]
MKSNIARTICLVTLLFGLATVAPAQSRGPCSSFSPAGTWGISHSGTIIFPTGAVPVAIAGTITVDINGKVSGTQTLSKTTLRGTITMNPDCTGTFTAEVYDQSGTLLRTVVWEAVYVDRAREAFGVATSLTLPNGASLPTIMPGQAKRMNPGRSY